MSKEYRLRVSRLERLEWKHPLYRRAPSLYVEVRLGDATRRTRIVKKSKSPIWNEDLILSSDEGNALCEIRLKHDSVISSDPCVGRTRIELVELLARCANGEVILELVSSKPPHSATTGVIVLHLEAISAVGGATLCIEAATEDIQSCGMTCSKFYQATEELLSRLEVFQKALNILSEIHPFLTIARSLASVLFATAQNAFETDKKLLRLIRTMGNAFAFVREVDSLPAKTKSLQDPIIALLKQTIECCLFVRHYSARAFLKRMLDSDSSQKISELERALEKLKEQIDSGMVLHITFVSLRTSQGVDDLLLRQRLYPDSTVGFGRPVCLPETRVDIRKQIIEWAFSEDSRNIFWLYGVAGSGKSTISTTLAEQFRSMSRLGAFLFFERGKSEASSVIRTIAYKLALFDSSIAANILAESEEDKDIASASALRQFDKLLLRPLLASTDFASSPTIIVLDALDECGTTETRRDLVELFRTHFPKLPNTFRFLITSRREPDLSRVLGAVPNAVCAMELDCSSPMSQQDVLSYLRYEMHSTVREHVVIPEDWPWDENLTFLGQAAAGLFIWAATAIKMVKSSEDPFYQLDLLVANSKLLNRFGLNELYATVLRSSGIAWESERSKTRFVKILALLLLSKVPISIETIDGILDLRPHESSRLILSRLRSLITYSQETPVALMHASFADYLASSDSSSQPWFVNIREAKHFMLNQCFSIMEVQLRFNICDIRSSYVLSDDTPEFSNRVRTCVPSHLEYVCMNWAQHLLDVPYSPRFLEQLSAFTYRRLLFWFEVLGSLKVVVRLASRTLLEAAGWTEAHDQRIASFLRDGSKLASVFAFVITQSPPHVYISMVALSKDDSTVAAHYSKYFSFPVLANRVGVKAPTSCLKVLEGHDSDIWSATFSPSGQQIASASSDQTIRVWDFDSGEEICSPLSGHEQHIWSVSYSPDGSRILSGSADYTIRVWDSQTGKLILGPLEGHSGAVRHVISSPDGTRMASCSNDGTIILWNSEDGKAILEPFVGHEGRVWAIGYSSDGKRLVSGGHDNTIRIWDAMAGKSIFEPFVGHTSDVTSVAFSPNNSFIASCSIDTTIRVWELKNRRAISIFRRHLDTVASIAYSPCGTHIAAGSYDKTVTIWDVPGGKLISGPLEGHSSRINSIAFSHDGQYVTSASVDKTIRVWDATSRAAGAKTFARHTDAIKSVTCSADGSHIATASWDSSIIVWDGKTGDIILGPLMGHTDGVNCITFSPDGSRLISGSWDRSVIIWNAETGEVLSDLRGHSSGIACIAASPDGKTIVSGSWDETIRVWDMSTGELVAGPLCGHSSWVLSCSFSPDGERLASGSWDKTIRIWNTKTWSTFDVLNGHNGHITSVCFAPDGTRIASGSWDKTIMIWDADSGDDHDRITYNGSRLLEGHEGAVSCVIFSSDGTYVFSGSADKTIRIWSVINGESIVVLEGHTGDICSLAVSPSINTANPPRIVSASEDNTIRMWDISDLDLESESERNSSPPSQDSETDAKSKSAALAARTDWVLDDDGWVVRVNPATSGQEVRPGSNHHDCDNPAVQRLLWVPSDMRRTLWRPRNTAMFSCEFLTKLDFTEAALGEQWSDCHNSTSSEK